MQWNSTSPFLQNLGYDPFSINKAPSYPQIIGEGDVTSVIFPDGRIQLYFVPTNPHVTLSPFPFNTNFPNHCTANKDIWFVRSISHPLGPSLLNRSFPNVYGDQQPPPPPQFNPNFCLNSHPCPDYYQKFHNDDSTSTTDIHYFYPSLRHNGHLKYSAEVQTEPFVINTNEQIRCQGPCACNRETVHKNTAGDATASSTSYMSIDSESKSIPKLTKRNKKKSKSKAKRNECKCCNLESKRSKHKSNKSRDHSSDYDIEAKRSKHTSNKSRDNSCDYVLKAKKSKDKSKKSRDHICECKAKTSDKLVTTFADQASGGVAKDGRHTQTARKKSKQADVKTKLWLPLDCNSSSMISLGTCDHCSGQCCLRSTSDTDN